MFKRNILITSSILCLFYSVVANGSIIQASNTFQKRKWDINSYPDIIEELVSSRYYFSAVPFLKEYLIRRGGQYSKRIDRLLDDTVRAVGIMQFEVLPERSLSSSRSPMVKYILAKKLFRKGEYHRALAYIKNGIPRNHPIRPFALNLQGASYSLLNELSKSRYSFEECIDVSKDNISSAKYLRQKRQYEMNRDYCKIGIARSYFAAGKFKKAEQSYLDIEKSSLVWPEILFEEGWTSFYLKDYNRTLGKLVTYKSPFFTHIFNPEIDILTAMTYLHMCLWKDVNIVVDEFYNKYEAESKRISKFVRKKKKNYKGYFQLANISKKRPVGSNKLLNNMLKSITWDPAYLELMDVYERGVREVKYVKQLRKSSFRSVLLAGLKDVLFLQRDLVGAYVRKGIRINLHNVRQSFKHMSYIKLEVLRHRKQSLYAGTGDNRTRGDVEYLERSDKQYFWTFNGEFWADELGDYVFALRSECR